MRIRKIAGPSGAREGPGLPKTLCVTLLTGVITVVTGCGAPSGEVGPATAYDHSGFSEVSVATEDVIAGQASTIAEGLEQGGYWCVQPRGNDVAVQIACQSPERDIRVDVLAAPDGDVLFAGIDLGAPAVSVPPEDVRDRLSRVLEADFLRR